MKTLETERLLLRAFEEKDIPAVQSYAGYSENILYMVWGPNSENETRNFVNMAISYAEKEPCKNHQYAVVLKENNILIGACDLSLSGDEGEIGWILHRNYWGQGYGSEMGKTLLSFGFDELGLHRIIAHCDAENQASYRLMEKIGMRREGLFLEARPANKIANTKYSDELSYAILKDEWEAQKEIAYYNSLPCVFTGFTDIEPISDGDIEIVCVEQFDAIPEKKYVPSYRFDIRKGESKVGEISLRIGYVDGLYYGGQIGYSVEEEYRGNGYAVRACRLAGQVAKLHGMTKLIITNSITNKASIRVCEKLGLKHKKIVRLPEWHELYKKGQRFVNIYEMTVE